MTTYKRKETPTKKSVRQSTKAPRKMAEARSKPDFKNWGAAHAAELGRHDAEIRTWVYEEELPSDKHAPWTMIYRAAKANQFGRLGRHKAGCAIRGDIMKPVKHFDETRTASQMPFGAGSRLLLAAAVSEDT